MRYPKFLEKNSTIGLCAPSFSVHEAVYKLRFENAKKKFEELGLNFVVGENVLKESSFAVSASAEERAREFEKLYLSKDVDMVFSVAGGEFMMDMLPYVDFEKIKLAEPKFYQGYSDNTNLTFLLTTICDVASIYAPCFPTFGMQNWHKNLEDNFKFLMGDNKPVQSFDMYEIEPKNKEIETALDGYNLTDKVDWKILSGGEKVNFKGRIIGGCLDILIMLCGTKFDKVKEFVERYKDDGIIWYLDSCDLNIAAQKRAIWQLKQAGWFKYASGFVIGRPKNKEEMFDYNYQTANLSELEDLDVPVIIDADIGHVPPAFHVVNGAIAEVNCESGKGEIKYQLI